MCLKACVFTQNFIHTYVANANKCFIMYIFSENDLIDVLYMGVYCLKIHDPRFIHCAEMCVWMLVNRCFLLSHSWAIWDYGVWDITAQNLWIFLCWEYKAFAYCFIVTPQLLRQWDLVKHLTFWSEILVETFIHQIYNVEQLARYWIKISENPLLPWYGYFCQVFFKIGWCYW